MVPLEIPSRWFCQQAIYHRYRLYFCPEEEPVLQTFTATPPPTQTDPPPLRAPRSTSWESTQCPAVPTPSIAPWPPTLHQAQPFRDVWAKPVPHLPDTNPQLEPTGTVSPPVLWLAATLKQQLLACPPALYWAAERRWAAAARLTTSAPHLLRLPSLCPHSYQKRGTCPLETWIGQITRTLWPVLAAVRQTCLARTRWQTSKSPFMVRRTDEISEILFHSLLGLYPSLEIFLHLSLQQMGIQTLRWMWSLSKTHPSSGTSQTSPESKVREHAAQEDKPIWQSERTAAYIHISSFIYPFLSSSPLIFSLLSFFQPSICWRTESLGPSL